MFAPGGGDMSASDFDELVFQERLNVMEPVLD